MPNIWDAEIVVSEALAKELIGEQFPRIAPVAARKMGEGFDNTIYEINESLIFRFPRREIAVELLCIEGKLLPAIGDSLSLPIPIPMFYGKPSMKYPWPFIGYAKVEGDVPRNLKREDHAKSGSLLGGFLKELHAFPIEKAIELDTPYDQLDRVNIRKRKERLMDHYKRIVDKGLWEEHEVLLQYLNELQPVGPGGKQVLCHGDLHINNILVGNDRRVSGIIDWGDVHIGHPAVDLSIAYSYLPKESREAFFEEYGSVEKEDKLLARFKAVYTSAVLLIYGEDVKDQGLMEAAKKSLAYSLE
ncbi:phosphotransferase [Falsibacillus albus]|uniref:DUF1679 domain-containing protein n=1 Tax=Falsibacillus albus TaxID=2478915 RepID=A0A3L7JS35_9BACI|nr:phosphotransferase [Falsibacillus albus]RLQ93085.1 DUF1679 domain-containing protein [Falsibacillus albus]